jgi:tetratricopeptide (TPR) repeat protein
MRPAVQWWAILAVSLLFSCTGKKAANYDLSFYLQKTGEYKEILTELFFALDDAQGSDENFALVREIANQYSKLNDFYRIIYFLSAWVNNHANDPYNGYYLLRIADSYIRAGSKPVAALYFDLIIRNYPDLIVRGESIHLACLKQLISLVDDSARVIWYYEQLIARFSEKIDLGAAYFMEGQLYEQLGKWEEAINAYRNFLPFYGTNIAGFPDAYGYAKQMVDFNTILKNYANSESRLDRTFVSLPTLLNVVRTALSEGNTWVLWSCRARVNFFVRSWTQTSSDDDTSDFNISSLSAMGNVQSAAELSTGSGPNEAYLKTWGWIKFAPVWYLYFRKIYYPMDPKINGRWEWAGIYYGERF